MFRETFTEVFLNFSNFTLLMSFALHRPDCDLKTNSVHPVEGFLYSYSVYQGKRQRGKRRLEDKLRIISVAKVYPLQKGRYFQHVIELGHTALRYKKYGIFSLCNVVNLIKSSLIYKTHHEHCYISDHKVQQ